jgi:AcrR family transcriptional regulator
MAKSRGSTRERLLEVAARLFSEQGYHTTTLDDIARAVGIGPSAVYKHFQNKLDIYGAVLDKLAAPFLALLEELDPESNAVEFALRVFRYHVEQPALARLALQASLNGGEHRRLLIERWYRPFYEKTALRMGSSSALAEQLPQAPFQFMAFNNMNLGYINLAALHAETLGVEPFSPAAVAEESELLRRFATTLMKHAEAQAAPVRSAAAPKSAANAAKTGNIKVRSAKKNERVKKARGDK